MRDNRRTRPAAFGRRRPRVAEQGIGLGATPDEVLARLLPMMTVVAGMPLVRISADQERRLRCGQRIGYPEGWEPPAIHPEEVAILDERGELIGIGRMDNGIQPRIVLGR